MSPRTHPENLTSHLRGSETIRLELDSLGADPIPVLQAVPGVTHVSASESTDKAQVWEVQSDRGADVRRELAATVISNGWGLLELRPIQMSLEDVFLELTTSEEHRQDGSESAKDAEAEITEATHE